MDESVALDSSKQKKFVKSVRGIKKLLKKNVKKSEETEVIKKKSDEVIKDGKVKKRKSRGLVYLSHIPHGFYEHQMTEYFKQFGVVTNARVIRSRRTGNSKGFAFVEFKEPAVAEIVAETMNNYLMGKRLIKAAYIPPNKQKRNALRKNWNTIKNPSSDERLMFRKLHNADKNEEQELKIARKLLTNLSKTKEKLRNLGINYDFFKPVDVPEALIDKVNDVISQTDVKPKKQVKNEPKEIKSEDIIKEIKTEPRKKKQLKQKQTENNDKSNESLVKKATSKSNKGKLKEEENKQNKQENQKSKKGKLKKGVPENFISIKESDDSDSNVDFDSDEFEKMIEMESDDDLSTGDDSNESEDEEIQESTKLDFKRTTKGSQYKAKAKSDLRASKKQNKGNVKTPSVVKRKSPLSAPVTAKKTKFEKQTSKMPINKLKNKKRK